MVRIITGEQGSEWSGKDRKTRQTECYNHSVYCFGSVRFGSIQFHFAAAHVCLLFCYT